MNQKKWFSCFARKSYTISRVKFESESCQSHKSSSSQIKLFSSFLPLFFFSRCNCCYCRCFTIHSRLQSNILVQLCGHNIMFDYLIRFLHEDFLQSLSSSHSNARSCSTTTEGTKCTEHRTIQKGRVQCTVGAVSISYLLCPIQCGGNFNSFK